MIRGMQKIRLRVAPSGEGGSLLIFMVWLLLLISIFSVAVGYQVRQRLRFIQHVEIRAKLRNIAEAGLRHAMGFIEQDAGSVASLKSSRGRFSARSSGSGP